MKLTRKQLVSSLNVAEELTTQQLNSMVGGELPPEPWEIPEHLYPFGYDY